MNSSSSPIPEGHKFGCVGLENAWTKDPISPLYLPSGARVFPSPQFDIDAHWKEWLGTIQVEHLTNSNLFFLVTEPANDLEVIDDQNKSLGRRVNMLFYGFLMQGFPWSAAGGLHLTGSNIPGEGVRVREVASLTGYYRPAKALAPNVDEELLRRADLVAEGLGDVFERRSCPRLRRGFRAWLNGIKESGSEDRLHEMVRALEALIRPEIGKSRKQFAHRVLTFIGDSRDERRLATELYELRSCVEHLHGPDCWAQVLGNSSETVLFQRTFEAQTIADDVYTRVLTRPELKDIFCNEDKIEAFWSAKDDERRKLWGPPLTLGKIVEDRFVDRPD